MPLGFSPSGKLGKHDTSVQYLLAEQTSNRVAAAEAEEEESDESYV